jgi:hypothetical protein
MGVLARKLLANDAVSLALAASAAYNSANTAVTTSPVTLPSGISAGNLLLMFFIKHNSTDDITGPSGWTELASCTPNGSDIAKIYAKIATGSEGSTENVTHGSNRTAAITYCITGNRNGVSSSEVAVSTVNIDGATLSPNPPNLTPSWGSAENLWIAVAFDNDGAFTFGSYPTNYTLGNELSQHGAGAGNAVITAARLLTGASEDPGAFTIAATSRVWNTFTLAVRPR